MISYSKKIQKKVMLEELIDSMYEYYVYIDKYEENTLEQIKSVMKIFLSFIKVLFV